MYNVYEQDQVITSWYNKDLINMHNAGDMSKQYVLNVWCPRFDHLVLTRIVYISILSAGTPCGNMVVGVFRNLFKRNKMWFHGMSTVKVYSMYLTQITLKKTKFTFFILSISFLCYHFIISPILLLFWHWRGVVNRVWPTFISDLLLDEVLFQT